MSHEWPCRPRDAMTVVHWAVRRNEPMLAAAVDVWAEHEALAALPGAAAAVIVDHVYDPVTQGKLHAAAETVIAEWRAGPDKEGRAAVESALWRLAGAVWVACSDTAREVFCLVLEAQLLKLAEWS